METYQISTYELFLSELNDAREAIARLSEYPVATRALLDHFEDLITMSEDFVHRELAPLGIESRHEAIIEVNKMKNREGEQDGCEAD